MAHGDQASGRADCAPASYIGGSAADHRRAFALATQAHRLDIQQLFDRERIVQLNHVEIFGAYTGLRVRLRDSLTG